MGKGAGSSWSDRIGMVSARYGSAREFATVTGLPEPRAKEILSGAEPTFNELQTIVDKTDLDGTWLLTGDGHYLRGTAAAQRFMTLTRQLADAFKDMGLPSKTEDVTAIVKTILMMEESRAAERVKTTKH